MADALEFGPIELKTIDRLTPLYRSDAVVAKIEDGGLTDGQRATVRQVAAHRRLQHPDGRPINSPFAARTEAAEATGDDADAAPAPPSVKPETVSQESIDAAAALADRREALRRQRAEYGEKGRAAQAIRSHSSVLQLASPGRVEFQRPGLGAIAGNYRRYAGLIALAHESPAELSPAQVRLVERSLTYVDPTRHRWLSYSVAQYQAEARQTGIPPNRLKNVRNRTQTLNTEVAMLSSVLDESPTDYQQLQGVYPYSHSVLWLADFMNIDPADQTLADIRAEVMSRLQALTAAEHLTVDHCAALVGRYGLLDGGAKSVQAISERTGKEYSTIGKRLFMAKVSLSKLKAGGHF